METVALHSVEEVEDFVRKKMISDYYEFVCKHRDISIEQFFTIHPAEYQRWRRVSYYNK